MIKCFHPNYFFARVDSINVVTNSLVLSNIEDTLSVGLLEWPIANSTFAISESYDENFYIPHSGTHGGTLTADLPAAGRAPYYETVLLKEGATFTSVFWKDTRDYGVNSDVIAYYIDPDTGVATEFSSGDMISSATAAGNSPEDTLRLRFDFPASNITAAAPQIFEVVVNYSTLGSKRPPDKIIYSRN